MRAATTLTQQIMSSGQATLVELYDITLATGQVYHFTAGDTALNGISVTTKQGTQGPFNYASGFVIVRDKLTLKLGTEAGNMEVLFAPQPDYPGGAPTIAGYPIMQAARYGFLAGALLQYNKLFLNAAIGNNTSAVGWFAGRLQDIKADRFLVHLTIDDFLAYLANQQMPQVLNQVGCFHNVYDAGCGLLKANFTSSGTITSVGDSSHFVSGLAQVSNYFNGGVLTFDGNVTPLLAGVSGPVNTFTQSGGGAFAMRFPFPVKPAVNDTFKVYPWCDKQQLTCGNNNTALGPNFNNLPHFSGEPYVPVPETILDGATDNPPAQTRGSTGGTIIGSQPSAKAGYGPYKS